MCVRSKFTSSKGIISIDKKPAVVTIGALLFLVFSGSGFAEAIVVFNYVVVITYETVESYKFALGYV